MRVVYVPSDMDGPGSYRCLFPGRQLREKGGFDTILPKWTSHEAKDGRTIFQFDVGLDPPSPMAHLWVLQTRLERMWGESGVQKLRDWGIAVIADVDDYYDALPEWNPAFYGTHPYRRDDGVIVNRQARRDLAKKMGGKIPPSKHNRVHMHRTFEVVDAMTVSTPFLKTVNSVFNRNITVIRNYLDWDIWESITPQYEVKRWGDRIRVGYLGHFGFHRGDVALLKPLIRPMLDRYPNVDFVTNSHAAHDLLDVPKRRRVVVKEYGFYPKDGGEFPVGRKTAVCDIGLVPLVKTDMNEAKSHLKGMEYNAAGIPYLASPTESYLHYTDEWRNGVTCHTPQDWVGGLYSMIENEELRRNMGWMGRTKAAQNTIQDHWQEWADVYDCVDGDEYDHLARGAIRRKAVQKVTELGSLLREAAKRELKVVVEVGSAQGGTFWSLAQIADDDALLVSIDIPGGSPIDTYYGHDLYAGRDRGRFAKMIKEGQRLRLIDANSQLQSTLDTLIDTLGTQPIDLLFIDADHRYQGVKRDYDLYSPLVREGGLIAFHDIVTQNQPLSKVHVFWSELKRKNRCMEFIGPETWGRGDWGGVGIVVKEVGRVGAAA